MAQRELRSSDVFLYISYDNGTTYATIICLTNNGITRARGVIETSTKCGTTSTAGTLTESVTFEGVIMIDPDAGKTSLIDLTDLIVNGTTFYFKQSVATPGDGDMVVTGRGYLSALDESYAVDSAATFSGTINPVEPMVYSNATS